MNNIQYLLLEDQLDVEKYIQIMNLLNAGDKLGAIRKYRYFTGADVFRAKDYVLNLEKKMRLLEIRFQPLLPKQVEEEVRKAIAGNGFLTSEFDIANFWSTEETSPKINAIKICRIMTGMGLKEAKETVEDIIYNRKDWPTITWEMHRKVSWINNSSTFFSAAPLLVKEEMGVNIEIAKAIVDAIIAGRIPCPPKPPKYRSIDEGWEGT